MPESVSAFVLYREECAHPCNLEHIQDWFRNMAEDQFPAILHHLLLKPQEQPESGTADVFQFFAIQVNGSCRCFIKRFELVLGILSGNGFHTAFDDYQGRVGILFDIDFQHTVSYFL